MGISAILLLAAIGGWAAFGFGVLSSRQQERVFRDQLTVALSERDRLSADLNQIRSELALVRADLEQNRQALERALADLKARPSVQLPALPVAAPTAAPTRARSVR
jgi:Holliday junction resolvasome RuvABC endonuclease subunit